MIRNNKTSTTFLLIVLLILPLFFLYSDLPHLYLKGVLLTAIFLFIVYLAVHDKFSAKNLGLRTDNFQAATIPYFIFTLAGVNTCLILVKVLKKSPLPHWWTYSHLQWAFLPISAAQEFVYRVYFQSRLQAIIKPVWAILIMSVLYSVLHILWKDPLMIFLTFLGGIGWGYLWYKYPNFYLLTLSHTVLNFIFILFGFFPWLITSYFKI